MFTLAICLSFVSIYCLYAISKVENGPKGILLFLKTRKTLARALAGSTFLLSTLAFIGLTGVSVGIFLSLLVWMTIASLMVVFIPFERMNWIHLAFGIIVIAGIESILLFS